MHAFFCFFFPFCSFSFAQCYCTHTSHIALRKPLSLVFMICHFCDWDMYGQWWNQIQGKKAKSSRNRRTQQLFWEVLTRFGLGIVSHKSQSLLCLSRPSCPAIQKDHAAAASSHICINLVLKFHPHCFLLLKVISFHLIFKKIYFIALKFWVAWNLEASKFWPIPTKEFHRLLKPDMFQSFNFITRANLFEDLTKLLWGYN